MANPIIMYFILSALGGLALGILITWLAMRGGKGAAAAKARHEQLSREFDAYRAQVDRHFVDTAEAVDELNRSYQKVVHHLSSGAQNLMGRETLQEQLALRGNKAVTVAYLAEAPAAAEEEEAPPHKNTEAQHDADVPAPADTPVKHMGMETVVPEAAGSADHPSKP